MSLEPLSRPRRRTTRHAVLAAVAVAASATAVVGTLVIGGGGHGVEPASANLWVDANGGTCSRTAGSGAAYSDAAACGSLAAAENAATGGDTVRIKNGIYGAQRITDAKSSRVTYVGESKEGVVFTGTVSLTDQVALRDLTITNDSHGFRALAADNTNGVRLLNVDMEGDYVSFHPTNVTDLQYIGGRFADFDGTRNPRTCSPTDDQPLWIAGGSDILIEGVHFGDTGGSPAARGGCANDGAHIEMVRIDQGAANVTLRRNVFNANGSTTATIFLSDFGARPVKPRIVGNVIGDSNVPVNYGAGACTDMVIAYNTVNYLGDFTACSSTAGTKIVGNLASKPAYAPPTSGAATFTDNVMQASADISYVGTWVSGPDFSLSNLGLTSSTVTSPSSAHLAPGSPAIDAGETPSASDICTDESIMGTRGDIDGDPRPRDGKCDAGADEYTEDRNPGAD
jgi:hypothetical protein